MTACSKSLTDTNTQQCSNQDKIPLKKNDVQPIVLSKQPITQSGTASHDKLIGYSFNGQSGQKLSYQTNQNICISIYTPDNQILSSRELSTNGKYVIQISAPQDSINFSLMLSLEDVAAVPASPLSTTTSEPTPEPTESISTSEPTPEPTESISTPASITSISPTSSATAYTPLLDPVIDRPSPEKPITSYYTSINNHEYSKAWDILSPVLQNNQQIHPHGYQSFIEWWSRVNHVSINQSYVVDSNNNLAVVKIWTYYHMNNGKSVPINLKFYMNWNNIDRKWDMIKIKTF